jgi:NADH dehydrogenase/NADH:ubiquinone oxidoreductase subunit G
MSKAAHNTPITVDEFKQALPAHIRKNVDQDVLDVINAGMADPEVLAVYRENVIGFTTVLTEGRFKLNDYLSAVKFVSHKLLGDNNIQSWAKTFPDRYNGMVQRGNSASEIASVCSRYASSKLVVLLLGQTLMPTHILNAPLYQKAINVQADLMMNAKSEKVRSDAAANLLLTLKPPEVKKVELSIGVQEDAAIMSLRESTMALVNQQRQMIESGMLSVRSIAESKLVTIDVTNA